MPTTHRAAPELASLLDGSSAGELIPELSRYGLQQLIELELAAFLGANRHERTEERLTNRNGYRPRTLTTQVGDLALQIPKLRAGSFLHTILEPRRGDRPEAVEPQAIHGEAAERGHDPHAIGLAVAVRVFPELRVAGPVPGVFDRPAVADVLQQCRGCSPKSLLKNPTVSARMEQLPI